MAKEIWGIKINRLTEKPKTYEQFSFEITKGRFADPLFYTSPRLREIIKKHSTIEGMILGTINYSMRLSGGKFKGRASENIYPFRNLDFPDYRELLPKFERKFIASELEKKVLTRMRQIHGNINIAPAMGTEPPREKQIKARKIKITEGYYETPISRMVSKINMLKRQQRKKRRKPKPIRPK